MVILIVGISRQILCIDDDNKQKNVNTDESNSVLQEGGAEKNTKEL